jgi:hypothetical protein
MDPEVIQIRRDICKDCARACDVRDTIDHADPCAACPERIWHAHGNCDPASPAPLRGLGDAVAVVAQPIARMIDLTAATIGVRTNVAGCGGCKARQAALNKALPFIQS